MKIPRSLEFQAKKYYPNEFGQGSSSYSWSDVMAVICDTLVFKTD